MMFARRIPWMAMWIKATSANADEFGIFLHFADVLVVFPPINQLVHWAIGARLRSHIATPVGAVVACRTITTIACSIVATRSRGRMLVL
jgi:hypothetical protein